MPARVEFDPTDNLVTLDLHGRIDLADATRILDEIMARPDIRSPNGLIDTDGLTGLDLVAQDIRQIAEFAERADAVWAGGRWAVVAPRDLVYGMARMYQLIRSGAPYEIEVFRTREEAHRWLAR